MKWECKRRELVKVHDHDHDNAHQLHQLLLLLPDYSDTAHLLYLTAAGSVRFLLPD